MGKKQTQQALTEKLGLQKLIGKSPVFTAEINKIPILAKFDVSVLISGETGTVQAKVREITAVDMPSFYRVRVDLPPDFDVSSLSSAPPGSIRVEAKILTQKEDSFRQVVRSFSGYVPRSLIRNTTRANRADISWSIKY